MSGFSRRSFDSPDESRTPPQTRVDVVRLEGGSAARLTFQPGWKWSEAVKPTAGTESCESHHFGGVVSGHLHVVHQDGSEGDVGPGDAYLIEPGHDAWVVGDEAVILFEFSSAETYAKG